MRAYRTPLVFHSSNGSSTCADTRDDGSCVVFYPSVYLWETSIGVACVKIEDNRISNEIGGSQNERFRPDLSGNRSWNRGKNCEQRILRQIHSTSCNWKERRALRVEELMHDVAKRCPFGEHTSFAWKKWWLGFGSKHRERILKSGNKTISLLKCVHWQN